MATDLQLTGGAYPLTIYNKEYKARTLTDKDHAELDAYVQSEVMKVMRATLTDDMSTEERREYIAAALISVTGMKWGDNEGRKIIASVKGMCRLGYQMIKANHPKMEFQKFYDSVLNNGDNQRESSEIQEVVDQIDQAFLILNTDYEKEAEVELPEDSTESSKSI